MALGWGGDVPEETACSPVQNVPARWCASAVVDVGDESADGQAQRASAAEGFMAHARGVLGVGHRVQSADPQFHAAGAHDVAVMQGGGCPLGVVRDPGPGVWILGIVSVDPVPLAAVTTGLE